ncbi:MAG TPA: hypothetical protein VH251_04800 [Verrucomicrobiae bacterium]|jgi:hypothetical protein|nr:hypothetical protein [Verrucomicrobiae bacterium]
MRRLTAIIATLAILTAGCASQPEAGSSIDGVPTLVSTGDRPILSPQILKQLVAKNRKILGQSRAKIHSLDEGLPPAQAASALPILAVAEQDGWFLYATATFTDANTHRPVGFISGLAVRHGTRDIIAWSTW